MPEFRHLQPESSRSRGQAASPLLRHPQAEVKPEPRPSRVSSTAASASGCLGDSLRPVELYILARHGESTLNFENRINGDPAVAVALTEKGREEARLLGKELAHIRLDLCLCTRFSRTRETAEIALEGRHVPIEVEPLLDDIDVGDLEGMRLEDYRAWKREHTRKDPFPGGESLDAAALRYAQAFRKLLDRPEISACDQRGGRLGRSRRARPPTGERDALPLRRRRPGPGRCWYRASDLRRRLRCLFRAGAASPCRRLHPQARNQGLASRVARLA